MTRLAEIMDVSRSKVYDYEQPRAGRLHAFKWSELIELCAALGCSVFELVLPDSGETVDVPEWVRPVKSVKRPPALGAVIKTPPGRAELSEIVFQLPADLLDPSKVDQLREKWLERQAAAMRELRGEFFKELRELGAMTPDEYREYLEKGEEAE